MEAPNEEPKYCFSYQTVGCPPDVWSNPQTRYPLGNIIIKRTRSKGKGLVEDKAPSEWSFEPRASIVKSCTSCVCETCAAKRAEEFEFLDRKIEALDTKMRNIEVRQQWLTGHWMGLNDMSDSDSDNDKTNSWVKREPQEEYPKRDLFTHFNEKDHDVKLSDPDATVTTSHNFVSCNNWNGLMFYETLRQAGLTAPVSSSADAHAEGNDASSTNVAPVSSATDTSSS